MLTTNREMSILGFSEVAAVFATDKVAVAPCEGMARVVGEAAYTGGAPVAVPSIDFSVDGVNWDFVFPAALSGTPAPGVTLYTWDLQVNAWAFVRVTLKPPVTACRAASRLEPLVQN